MPPAAPTSAPDDVHRLRDILVEEVSIVDRAANKRRWLIVKRETGMPPELQQSADGRGDLSFSDGATETAPAPAAKAGEAGAEGGDAGAAEGGAAPAGALQLPAGVKGLVVGILTDAMERLMALVNRVQDASVPADSDPGDLTVPADIGTAIVDVTDRLGAFMKQYKVGKAAEPAAAAPPAAGAPAPAQKAAAPAAAPAGQAGKPKVSPARLARFEKTFALLEELLQELSPLVPTPAQAAAAVAAATPVATAPASAAPAQKRAPVAAVPTAAGIPAAIAGQLAELKKGLEQAQAFGKTVDEQAAVIKAQAAELAKLRKSVPPSQVAVVDHAPAARPGAAPDPVSWPMDLNREIRRDKVDKSVSFFEVG